MATPGFGAKLRARFGAGPATPTNVNQKKAAVASAINAWAKATNAQMRNAAMGGGGNAAKLSANVNSTRNASYKSLNNYLGAVVKANINKAVQAKTASEAAAGAANAAMAAKVLDIIRRAGVANPNAPTQANVQKLQNLAAKVTSGKIGSRVVGTARVSNNMVRPLQNKIGQIVAKFGALEQQTAAAAAVPNIRSMYISAINQLGAGASNNARARRILNVRSTNNKNRNLSTLKTGNKYNAYFNAANAILKQAVTQQQANVNKVFRIENKNVTIKKQPNGKWKIMNENIASRWGLNNSNNPTRAVKLQA